MAAARAWVVEGPSVGAAGWLLAEENHVEVAVVGSPVLRMPPLPLLWRPPLVARHIMRIGVQEAAGEQLERRLQKRIT